MKSTEPLPATDEVTSGDQVTSIQENIDRQAIERAENEGMNVDHNMIVEVRRGRPPDAITKR